MSREQSMKEIREARNAGEQAIISLENARDLLNSAGNWGIWDMFGGGLISGLMKHSKMDAANTQMEQARYQLQCFQKELRDVDVPADFRMDVSEFLIFADFFFDGIIADWMVQSKISDAKTQVNDAIVKVQNILRDLNQWENHLIESHP